MLDSVREPQLRSRLKAIAVIALAAASIDLMGDCGGPGGNRLDHVLDNVWYDCSIGSDRDLHGIAGHYDGSVDSKVAVVGAGGMVLESSIANSVADMDRTAACGAWLDIGPNTTATLRGVWKPDNTTVWAAGGDGNTYNGTVLQYDGVNWTLPGVPSNISYNAIWGSAACDLYFLGVGISTDFPNGAHFDCSVIDTLMVDMGWSEITDISGRSSDDIWVVMNQPTYNVWHYDGTSWENHWQTWMDQSLFGVYAFPNGVSVVAVGANGAVHWFNGTEWRDHTTPEVDADLYDVWGYRHLGPATWEGGTIAVGEGGIYWLNPEYPSAGLARSTDVALRGVWGRLGIVRTEWGSGPEEDLDLIIYYVGDDGTILMERDYTVGRSARR